MKEIRYLPVVLLLLQPVVGSAHNSGNPLPSETTATVVIDASSAEKSSSIPRPHAPNAASNPNVPKCTWDELDAEARASLWPTLSARHRDYHWHLMTNEERAELRAFLPKIERRRLRERFVTNHQLARDNDRPYVLYKRLSKQELCELREQVRQANKQLVMSEMLKTPAQIEYEDQFLSKLAEMNDLNHQMLIVTIQESASESIAAAGEQKTAPTAQDRAPARVSP
ncbi:hypothetical protein [Parasutterella sp.]|uniref:hypothetical protein n=1 Tax=Parasutterella sp. TaxID=2049037 RepID=UPI00352040DA